MTKHADRPSFLVAALGVLTKAQFVEMLAPIGIGPAHYGVLRWTAEHEGASQQEVADLLGVRRSVMVGLVDDLESADLLRRDPHPADRRAHALNLTTAGRRTLTRARRICDDLDAEVLAPLPPDEREAFCRALLTLGAAAGLECGIYPQHDGNATRHEGVPRTTA